MLKIGDLSRLSQVSVKTLRYYGDLGLLPPARIDRYTGYRYYRTEQMAQLNRILALKDLGFSLDEIGRLMREAISTDELRGMLRLRRTEAARRLDEERARLTRVEARLRQIDAGLEEGAYPVLVKPIEARRVLALESRVHGYGQVAPLLAALQTAVREGGYATTGGPPLARYSRAPDDRAMTVQVGTPVGAGVRAVGEPSQGLSVRTWSGAPASAVTLHVGDPEGIGAAYGALMGWIAGSGLRAAGPSLEVYLHGPGEGAGTGDWLTEVRLPVESYVETLEPDDKERMMNPEIVERPALVVIGQLYRGKNEHGEIPAMWDQLNTRWDELQVLRAGDAVAYGVCGEMAADGTFEYLAGVEAAPGTVPPAGWVRWQVPAQTYAVFPCTLATLHQAYEQAYGGWLPTSGYRRSPGLEFELYPATFEPDDPSSQGMFIYIPVTR